MVFVNWKKLEKRWEKSLDGNWRCNFRIVKIFLDICWKFVKLQVLFVLFIWELQPCFMHLHSYVPSTNFLSLFYLSMAGASLVLKSLLAWPVTLLFIIRVGYTRPCGARASYINIRLNSWCCRVVVVIELVSTFVWRHCIHLLSACFIGPIYSGYLFFHSARECKICFHFPVIQFIRYI